MEPTSKEQIPPLEKTLLCIECPPWSALYRIAVGWLILPMFFRLFGREAQGYRLILFFGAVLIILRLAPMILRKVFPFSKAAQAVWFERRNVSKQYDSYQWRKLFWIGLGLAVYTFYIRDFRTAHCILIVTCLVGGAIGLGRWRHLKPRVSNSL